VSGEFTKLMEGLSGSRFVATTGKSSQSRGKAIRERFAQEYGSRLCDGRGKKVPPVSGTGGTRHSELSFGPLRR